MDALALLLERRSQPRLSTPAPAGEALENIKQAALRAPDHGGLTPWRFIVCEGGGLKRLGLLFEQSAIENGKSAKEVERAPQLPLRAPMVIVAIARYQDSPKVPRIEQVASASCAVMSMQMAAQAQGFNGIWRTGTYAQCELVRSELGLAEDDELVGFLYLGTPAVQAPPPEAKAAEDFFEHWT